MKKYLCLIVILYLVSHSAIAQDSLKYELPKLIVGAHVGYIRVFRKAYPERGVTEQRLFGYWLRPRVMFRVNNNWHIGGTFQYAQSRDVVQDTFLKPVIRGIGVMARRTFVVSTRHKLLVAIEPQLMFNNASPLSTKTTATVYTRSLNQPQIAIQIGFSKVLWNRLAVGIATSKTYYTKTNKFFFRGDSVFTFEYMINKK